MDARKILSDRFAASRAHLQAVAYRMLGSAAEAEDAVQEAWLRLLRSDAAAPDNVTGWLTTVVARICLDVLRSRKARREDALGAEVEAMPAMDDAEEQRRLADSVGAAMLIVLDALPPAERVAFVLHDMFNLPFDDIAAVVGRSPAAARQLASRARRRVRGAPAAPEARRPRELVEAFLAASQRGDFAALLAVLDPDVTLRADAAAVQASLARADRGAPPLAPEIRGRERVAETFRGRAAAAKPATIDGAPGLVFAPGGQVFAAFAFVVDNQRIVEIRLISEPASLAALRIAF